MVLWNGKRLTLSFLILAVTRPILSLGRLREANFDLMVTRELAYFSRGRLRSGLLEEGRLFYLPVRLPGSDPWSKELFGQIQMIQNTLTPPGPEWAVFLWSRVKDNPLAQHLRDRGHQVQEVGLPDFDLTDSDTVKFLIESIREVLTAGKPVLLWATLPSGPWEPDGNRFFEARRRHDARDALFWHSYFRQFATSVASAISTRWWTGRAMQQFGRRKKWQICQLSCRTAWTLMHVSLDCRILLASQCGGRGV